MVIFEGLFYRKKYGPQPIVINQLSRQPIATHQFLLLLLLLLLAHLGPNVGPSSPYVVPSAPMLGPSWAYVGPSWAYVRPSWGYVNTSWTYLGGLCWVILGYILRHLR